MLKNKEKCDIMVVAKKQERREMENKKINEKIRDPIYHTIYGGILISMIGGILETYTFLLRGGVFCNAQTGNIVLMMINIINGELFKGFLYSLSITAFIVGIFLSKFISEHLSKRHREEWHIFLILFIMILLIAVGFIPKDGGDYLANLLVSFICALFYNTYREAGGVVYSSVMCTNNLRIASSHFYDFIFLRKGDAAHRFLKYFLLLAAFVAGAAVQVFISKLWGVHSVIFGAAICGFMFIWEIYYKINKKKI